MTPTSMIVLEWAEIVQSFQQPTTLAMDRFASIAQLLRPGVRQQGDTPGHGMVSEEKLRSIIGPGKRGVGKKFALSNCFTLTPQRSLPDKIPIYDHYKEMFSGCDAFNQQMHNRTFPYALPRAGYFSQYMELSLYKTVLNCWNAWRSVLRSCDAECEIPSYVDFCHHLALDIIERLCH